MKLLAKLGGEAKALGAELKSRPFSAYGGSYGSAGYSGGTLPGYGMQFSGGLPGSQYDDHTAAGVLWENPAAAACFVALTKAFAQARPYMEKRVRPDSNEWKREDHPLIELLERPNPYYSGEKMFGVTLVCAMSQGAAFWRFERDRKGDVSEIWYEPPVGLGATGIAPNWDRNHFIKDFYYFVDGQRSPEPIPREDVIYFRHGLNVANPRLPWSPLGLGAREIAVLNSASSYTSAVMRNHGMPAGFVSMDGGGLSSSTPPTPEQAESLKAQIENRFGGPHNAGKTFVSSLPWKWNKVGMTPAEMVIDKIRQWPQETVCALLGTPVIVALLPTGEQPTYQNLDASMRWWWDNTIIPLEDAFADEIETQMFPAFGLDAANYRLAWDRSRIPALQEDESAKHAMWREDYRAGGIDRYTYLTKIGEQADEKLKGVLHPSATPNDSDESDTLPAAKAFWDEELKQHEFRESDWIRKGGRFQHYVGVPKAPDMMTHRGSYELRDDKLVSVTGEKESGKSGNEERKNIKWQGESLDAMHKWHGDSLTDELSDLQREKFTNSLAKAIRYLEVNAREGYKEAAVAVPVPGDSEWHDEIIEGDLFKIEYSVPTDRYFATLHTHPYDGGPSVEDWINFLSRPLCIQMYIITPRFTFVFTKPLPKRKAYPLTKKEYDAKKREVEDEIGPLFDEDTIPRKPITGVSHSDGVQHLAGSGRVTRQICEIYDILYRIGVRSSVLGG